MLSQLLAKVKDQGILASLIRGASTVFMIQVLGSGIGYLAQVAFARWMGVSEYGLYTYIITCASIGSTLPQLGLRDGVVRFISQYRTQKDPARLQGTIRSSWALVLGASVLFALLGTGVVLMMNAQSPLSRFPQILLGLWIMPLVGLIQLNMSIMQAFRNMVAAFAPMRVIRPLGLMLGAAILFFWQGGQLLTSTTMLWVTVALFLSILVGQIWIIRRDLLVVRKERPPIYQVRTLLRVSLPLLLVAGFSNILHQSDLVMIGMLIGTDEVGLYNAAVRTAGLVGFALTAVSAIAAPMISSTHAENDPAKLQKLVTRSNQLLILPSLGITLGVVILARPILSAFGPDFVSMQWVLTTLALGQFVRAATGPVGILLDQTGHQDDSARIRAGVATINITLNLVGIYFIGVLGAALATAIATLIEKMWLDSMAAKRLNINASFFSMLRLKKSKSR